MSEFETLHYPSGDEIHLGDRIQFDGTYATVVALSDGTDGQYSPGYEDWSGMDRGIVICDDDGGITSLPDGDTRLELVDRSAPE